MIRHTRLNNNEKGAAFLEFALCFLVFLGAIYGVMEFSRIVYSYTVLAGATREATRYAIVHGSRSGAPATEADIETQVRRWAIGLNPAALNVSTTWTAGSPQRVRVQTSYNIAPFTRLIIPGSLTLGSRSEMVISQ
jgi:Flp pilus assembly protein TadG